MTALRSLLLAFLCAAAHAAPTGAGPVVGTTTEVSGIAVAQAGSARRALGVASPLELEDTVLTGSRSRLKAVLGGTTRLSLSADARLEIDRFVTGGGGGSLLLQAGAILVDAAPGSFRRPLTVKSPYGVVGIRGTRFFAGVIGDTFGVFCASGRVSVSAGGRTVLLIAGQGVDIPRAGGPPGPVRQWGAPKIARALALVE
jgi:ferric-dicitrate binding protein FerR (iron transport regulator)